MGNGVGDRKSNIRAVVPMLMLVLVLALVFTLVLILVSVPTQ